MGGCNQVGYLRKKYGTAEELKAANSNFIKFLKVGDKFTGTVDEIREGKYGTEIAFTNKKIVGLQNRDLLEKVAAIDPEEGDKLEITLTGFEELDAGESRNPTKYYKVRVARAAPVEFEEAGAVEEEEPMEAEPVDDFGDEPF
jgi:hypothetical protein